MSYTQMLTTCKMTRSSPGQFFWKLKGMQINWNRNSFMCAWRMTMFSRCGEMLWMRKPSFSRFPPTTFQMHRAMWKHVFVMFLASSPTGEMASLETKTMFPASRLTFRYKQNMACLYSSHCLFIKILSNFGRGSWQELFLQTYPVSQWHAFCCSRFGRKLHVTINKELSDPQNERL